MRHLREHDQKLWFTAERQNYLYSRLLQNHLQLLRGLLGNYFPDLNDFDYKLISNLFEIDSKLLPHNLQNEF